MIPKSLLLLLAIWFILIAGCSVKTYPTTTKTHLPLSDSARLLTAHTWKESHVIVDKFIKGDTVQYDITRQFASVDRDDYTVFYRDGTFLFEEGNSKFTSASAQKYQRGTWELVEREALLTLTSNNATDRYAILDLTPFKMVLSLSVSNEDANYKYTITYTTEIVENQIYPKQTDNMYTEVEIQPEFPGGNRALTKLLTSKQKYPLEARKRGIEGKVVVEFIIHEDGTPGNFEVIQNLGYGCDEAAVQTLRTMPAWTPGRQKGQPVKVKMAVPIAFKLD